MTNQNPYSPPESSLAAPIVAPAHSDLATTGQRFANYILDSFGLSVFAVLIGSVFEILTPGTLDQTNEYVVGLLIGVSYYAGFEFLFGRTPAKWLTGTRVVCEDGRHPNFARVLGRTAARMIPFEAFSFLGGEGRPVGWHDSLSKTRVLRTRGESRR